MRYIVQFKSSAKCLPVHQKQIYQMFKRKKLHNLNWDIPLLLLLAASFCGHQQTFPFSHFLLSSVKFSMKRENVHCLGSKGYPCLLVPVDTSLYFLRGHLGRQRKSSVPAKFDNPSQRLLTHTIKKNLSLMRKG